jgi:hypothetical protein
MKLELSSPPKGLRLKAAGGIATVLAVISLNYAGATLWPRYAHFFPPTLLLIVVLLTVFYSLMVWRTEWIVSKLFPGQTAPVVSKNDRFIALISVVLAVMVTGIWIRSLFAT